VSRRLVVWRHGETDHNAGGVYQGQLDTHLSSRGREQARRAAAVLAGHAPDRIVASDLARAMDTAAALAAATGLAVDHDPRLREIDVGSWAGRSHTEIVEAYPEDTAAIARGHDVVRGEHGESVEHVARRTAAAAADITAAMGPDDLVVVATHGMAGRTMVAGLLGWTQRDAWLSLVGLRNCHWAELEEQSTGWRLVSWNASATH
jgi:glucosyl-3-phosphoglycerate phosphatase